MSQGSVVPSHISLPTAYLERLQWEGGILIFFADFYFNGGYKIQLIFTNISLNICCQKYEINLANYLDG